MKIKTTKKLGSSFEKALASWNKLTRQEQECLCKKNPNDLSEEQVKWIETLLEVTNSEKQPKFSSCKPEAKEKQLRKFAEQVRKWSFEKMVESIFLNNRLNSIKKDEKRMLLINSLWIDKPKHVKDEILLKRWETLDQNEMIWIPGLLQIVYRISEKNWENYDNSKRTKLISQLDNFLRQDRLAVIVGGNLRKIRISLAKWNQSDVAKLIGSNQSILSKIENGQNVEIHHFLDLLAVYSQHVSIDGIFSESFSVIKKSDRRNTKEEIAEQTFTRCQQTIKESIFLIQEILTRHTKDLMSIHQSTCGNQPTQEEENLKWLITTQFSPEQIAFIRRALNEATPKSIEVL